MATATRTNPLSYLTEQLNDLKAKGTYFRLRVLEDEQAPECTFDGKRVINLASNNYLGLTKHPKLRDEVLAVRPDTADWRLCLLHGRRHLHSALVVRSGRKIRRHHDAR